MKNIDFLQIIIDEGLSVRQIPFQVVEVYDATHCRDGDEIFTRNGIETFPGDPDKKDDWGRTNKQKRDEFDKRFPNGRKFCRRIRIPQNPGYWMCQKITGTSSMIQWSTKKDNLAPTLQESIQLYLQNKPAA